MGPKKRKCTEERVWTDAEVFQLIEFYEAHELLWDVAMAEYKDSTKRINALEEIGKSFSTSAEEVRKKILKLRRHYANERKPKGKSGDGGDGEAEQSCWKFYNALSFLDGVMRARSSASSISNEDDDVLFDDNSEDLEVGNTSESSGGTGPEIKRNCTFANQKRKTKQPAVMDSIGSAISKTTCILQQISDKRTNQSSIAAKSAEIEDEDASFCDHMRIELKTFTDPFQKRRVKNILENALFQAQMQSKKPNGSFDNVQADGYRAQPTSQNYWPQQVHPSTTTMLPPWGPIATGPNMGIPQQPDTGYQGFWNQNMPFNPLPTQTPPELRNQDMPFNPLPTQTPPELRNQNMPFNPLPTQTPPELRNQNMPFNPLPTQTPPELRNQNMPTQIPAELTATPPDQRYVLPSI